METITYNIQITLTQNELDFILSNGGENFESFDSYECYDLCNKCILSRCQNGLYIGTEILYKILDKSK